MISLSLPTWRLNTALAHTAHALREYRAEPWRGGALSRVIAECWGALGRRERYFLLLTAAQAADPADLDELVFLLGGPPTLGVIHGQTSNRRHGGG